MVVGPFRTVLLPDGKTSDLFILRYGPEGELLSPQTREALDEKIDAASDVFLFSHGWNNSFDDAAGHYVRFAEGYARQTARRPPGYRPLLIGIVWPSISFLMPWEDGPQIAADPHGRSRIHEEMRGFVASGLDTAGEARLSELLDGREEIPPDEARQAAEIVRAGVMSDEGDDAALPTIDEMLSAWAALDGNGAAKPKDPDAFRDAPPPAAGAFRDGPPAAGASRDGPPAAGADQPRAAASWFDIRNLLRMGTVWKMKDRAGRVGGLGVAPLVVRILADPGGPRLHLIGHSFGARLVLSALAMRPVARKAHSVLLLQPAINRWCFAPSVPGLGRAGGYAPVLSRVEKPVLTTSSTHDFPLHEVFHLALRGSNLGEPNVAAVGDTERFGALGGYGPAGLGQLARTVDVVAPGTPYALDGPARVVTLNGSGMLGGAPAIGGHSDVNTPRTWWALHSLTGD